MTKIITVIVVLGNNLTMATEESSWGSWTSCSKTCGPGVQTRYRDCMSEYCPGENSEERNCNLQGCEFISYKIWAI